MPKERKDATIARSDPEKRAEIEAARGIVRDGEGRIIRSKEWKKERAAYLGEKKKDMQNRISNIDAEVAALEAELNA
ncbi:MAG TPA: hypothetical protein VIG74_00720 [Alphaproteobacteria bacterium]|jgi:ribosomal protein S6